MKRKRLAVILSVFLVLIIGAACTFFWAYSYYKDSIYKPMPGDTRNVDIEIKAGTSTNGIADLLYNEGLIKNTTTFKIYLKRSNLGGKLKAGKYELASSMNVPEIIDKIVSGDVKKDTVWITIPEGYALKDIAEEVEKSGLAQKDEFINAAQSASFDYDFLKDLPGRPVKLEGYLFPDTYEFQKDVTPEQIINKMLSRFDEIISGDIKSKAGDMNLSIDQVVTVASMIEKEAVVPSERPTIAGVIYNRLKINMKLQIDATVQYALGEWKAKLLTKDTQIDSPYNTYKYTGLPAGPISNPGKASIEAAVNPENVDYLYYVLKKDSGGTHVFSRTYNEHLKAIQNNKAN